MSVLITSDVVLNNGLVTATVKEDIGQDGTFENQSTIPLPDGVVTSEIPDLEGGVGNDYSLSINLEASADGGTPVVNSPNIETEVDESTYIDVIPDVELNGGKVVSTIYEDTTGDGIADNSITSVVDDSSDVFRLFSLVGGATNDYWAEHKLVSSSDGDTPVLNGYTIDTQPSSVSLAAAYANKDVTLQWTGGSDDSYNVYRAYSTGSTTADYTQIATGVTDTTYQELDVEDGIDIFYRVAPVNGGVEGTPSNEVQVNTDVPDPDGLVVTNPNTGTANLSWVKNDNNDGGTWEIYRSTDGTLGTQIATVNTPATTTYTDNTIVDGETYYYTVRRVVEIGIADTSRVSIQTNLYDPTNIQFVSEADNSFTITWNDNNTGEVSFNVFESTDGGSTFTNISGNLVENATSYTTSPKDTNTIYTYKVRANSNEIYADSATIIAQHQGYGFNNEFDGHIDLDPTQPDTNVPTGAGTGVASPPEPYITNEHLNIGEVIPTDSSIDVEQGTGQIIGSTIDSFLGSENMPLSSVDSKTTSEDPDGNKKQAITVSSNDDTSPLTLIQVISEENLEAYPLTINQTIIIRFDDLSKLIGFDASISHNNCDAEVNIASIKPIAGTNEIQVDLEIIYNCPGEAKIDLYPKPDPEKKGPDDEPQYPEPEDIKIPEPENPNDPDGPVPDNNDWDWPDDEPYPLYTNPPRLSMGNMCIPNNEMATVPMHLHYGGHHAEDVYGWEAKIDWDPTVLSFDNISSTERTPNTTEGFEDKDISKFNGNIGSYSIETANPINGDASLTCENTSGTRKSIWATEKTMSRGDKVDSLMRKGNSIGIIFLVSDLDGDFEGYLLQVHDPNNPRLGIWRRQNGGWSQFGNNPSVAASTGDLLRIEAEPMENGTINCSVYRIESDGSETELASISPTDNTFETGCVGVSSYDSNKTEWDDISIYTESTFNKPEIMYHYPDSGIMRLKAENESPFRPWDKNTNNRLCDLNFDIVGVNGDSSRVSFVETYDEYYRPDSPYRGQRPADVTDIDGSTVSWKAYTMHDEWRPFRFNNGGVSVGNGINISSSKSEIDGVTKVTVSSEVATLVSGFNLTFSYPGTDRERTNMPTEFVKVEPGDIPDPSVVYDDELGTVSVSADREAANQEWDDPVLCELYFRPRSIYQSDSTVHIDWIGGTMWDVNRADLQVDCTTQGNIHVQNEVPTEAEGRKIKILKKYAESAQWPITLNHDYTVTGIQAKEMEKMNVEILSSTNPGITWTVNEVTTTASSATANVTIVIPKADPQKYPIQMIPKLWFDWGNSTILSSGGVATTGTHAGPISGVSTSGGKEKYTLLSNKFSTGKPPGKRFPNWRPHKERK